MKEYMSNTGDENHDDGQEEHGLALKTRPKAQKPSMYKVLLLNDDYTPMEFVVHILEHFFGSVQGKPSLFNEMINEF